MMRKSKISISIFGSIMIILLFLGCANPRDKARSIFLPVKIRQRAITVDSQDFPDRITLFFCAENFAPNSAELCEIVQDSVNFIQFSATKIIPDSLKILVFLQDCSGSMKSHIAKLNNTIKNIADNLRDIKIALVRVGKEPIVALEPVDASSVSSLNFDELEYPSPKGTKLNTGIATALEIIGTTKGAIVILTDGSVGRSNKILQQVKIAQSRGIQLTVIQVSGVENDILKSVSAITGGFFSAENNSSLEEILTGGWNISYTPAITDTNGAIHNVVLRWGAQKRTTSYRAPGSPPTEIEVVDNNSSIPTELIEGVNVPFMEPGNANILPLTKAILDSIIEMIDQMDIASEFKLAVAGYTCDLGSEEFNNDLSFRRAKSAANYIRQNYSRNIKFDINSYGESDPLLPNTCEENRRANRRVEIRLIIDSDGNQITKTVF